MSEFEIVQTPLGPALTNDGGVTLYGLIPMEPQPALGVPAEQERKPCRHEGAKWTDDNRKLVCPSCSGEFAPGTCMQCGRPAGGERTLADGSVVRYSVEGFSCARCAGA